MKSVSHIVSLMLLLFSFATPFPGYTQDMLQKLPLATLEQLLKARPQQDTIAFRFKQYRIVVRLKSGVEDNGNGIPQNIIDKIFQPFFTTKPTGSGTGLGLSLSYDIITKEHGSTLKVESSEGKGSVFVIQLPA